MLETPHDSTTSNPRGAGGALPAIRARGVGKRFGEFAALSALDLDVYPGECVGLLGPNGAGKSTFIGCLYGAVLRTSGDLQVFGLDPAREARRIKQRLGVVPQENALDEELTVTENMQLYARFEGLDRQTAGPRIDALLKHMSLDHKREAQIKMLSGGMKRRLAFVRALLSDPELLILDEPTTGLDPTVRHLLWEKVISYRRAGKTVLVTTHYMHEAELLCDRIVILNRGTVVDAGAPRDLIAQHAPGFVGIFAREDEGRLRPHLRGEVALYQQGWQSCVRAPGIEELTALQAASGTRVLQLRPANLEDVYLKLTGQDIGADE
ncbi:MAG: ABC transporter ATP-binding protein [Verrucomicrobiaceae bacterium]|nr:MAG: ABC transporter ATP-binding protein [Verrucomicrobiaceae bacterium]